MIYIRGKTEKGQKKPTPQKPKPLLKRQRLFSQKGVANGSIASVLDNLEGEEYDCF